MKICENPNFFRLFTDNRKGETEMQNLHFPKLKRNVANFPHAENRKYWKKDGSFAFEDLNSRQYIRDVQDWLIEFKIGLEQRASELESMTIAKRNQANIRIKEVLGEDES